MTKSYDIDPLSLIPTKFALQAKPFNSTTIAGRLGTVSWSDNHHQTSEVYRITDSTIPLSATDVSYQEDALNL